MCSGKPPPPGLGKEGRDFRGHRLRGQAFVLLSILEKHRWGDGAPAVGEGTWGWIPRGWEGLGGPS